MMLNLNRGSRLSRRLTGRAFVHAQAGCPCNAGSIKSVHPGGDRAGELVVPLMVDAAAEEEVDLAFMRALPRLWAEFSRRQVFGLLVAQAMRLERLSGVRDFHPCFSREENGPISGFADTGPSFKGGNAQGGLLPGLEAAGNR